MTGPTYDDFTVGEHVGDELGKHDREEVPRDVLEHELLPRNTFEA